MIQAPARRRLLAALALAVLAAAWVYAATRLWRTSVPAGLELPRLDPGAFFSQSVLSEAASYQRFLRITDVLASVAVLVALAVYALRGERFARESAAGRIGTGMLLGMLGLAFVWIAQLPFGFAELWWHRRHDVTDVGYVEWVVNDWLLVGGQFLFVSAALLVVMALAGVWRRSWWLAAAPVLASLAVGFAFVQPYLLAADPVADPAIQADAKHLATAQSTSVPDVRVLETRGEAESPNALAAGLGPSERVVLWDTLVDGFERPEVRLVLAHEIGHLARDHIWQRLAWMALLALPVGLLVSLATRRRGGLYEPGAVPVALLAVAVLALVLAPLERSFSQRLEAEADWVALESTRDPDAADSLFVRFTEEELIDPSPPGWSRLLHDSHPPIIRRLEMAEAWRQR